MLVKFFNPGQHWDSLTMIGDRANSRYGELPRENSIFSVQKIESVRSSHECTLACSKANHSVFRWFRSLTVVICSRRTEFCSSNRITTFNLAFQSTRSECLWGRLAVSSQTLTNNNVRDLWLLSNEFKFTTLSTAVADWRPEHPSPDAETGLITGTFEEQLQSHDRAIRTLEEKVDQLRQAVLESIRGENAAFFRNAAKDIELAVEQGQALGRQVSALEGEIGSLREAIATIGTKMKEDIVKVEREAKDGQRQSQERAVQAVADVQGAVERLGMQLQAVVEERDRQVLVGAEMWRANEAEVGGLKQRVEMLDQDNRRLSEANAVVRRDLVAAVAEESVKVKQDLTNLERELAKLNEEMRATRQPPELLAPPQADIAVSPALAHWKPLSNSPPSNVAASPPVTVTPPSKPAPVIVLPLHPPPKQAKEFRLSMKKGKLRCSDGSHTTNTYDIPGGIIAHLTRECGGNVHDRNVITVTSGSFERETQGANPHSGVFDNKAEYAAKNVADLETDSRFYSAFREKKKDIPHARNNWLCYDFKERRTVPTYYTVRTN
jgi:hypothetical protein